MSDAFCVYGLRTVLQITWNPHKSIFCLFHVHFDPFLNHLRSIFAIHVCSIFSPLFAEISVHFRSNFFPLSFRSNLKKISKPLLSQARLNHGNTFHFGKKAAVEKVSPYDSGLEWKASTTLSPRSNACRTTLTFSRSAVATSNNIYRPQRTSLDH